MAKSKFQKLKLLYIKDFFEENSDSEHGVTVAEIIDFLDSVGIEAERKSIYDDISLLCDYYGMNIEKKKVPHNTEYYLLDRRFDMHELKLLCDSVEASRFITDKKSRELIDKLKSECSRHEAAQLSRQVLVSGKIKNMNESIYYNVDAIFRAIECERCVSFLYFSRSLADKSTRIYRKGGARYEASPFALTYSDDKYYLIAYDLSDGEIKHFRVDRMEKIEQTDTPRDGQKYFSSIDLAKYTDRHFGMFGGEVKAVGIEFEGVLAGAVYDRFGEDITAIKTEDGRYRVTVFAAISEQFFGWVAGLGLGTEIVSPEDVRQGFVSHISKILEKY